MKYIPVLVLFFPLAQSPTIAQTVYYVNYGTGSNSNPGTSWGAAFRDVTKALAVAQSSSAAEVDIWVAAGTYTPIDGISVLPADHQDTSFAIYRGDGIGKTLKIYGGFGGTETTLGARIPSNITYLEGSLGSGNVYHVAVVAGMSATADSVVIDGFTFRDGIGGSAGSKVFNGSSIGRCNGAGLVLMNNLSSKLVIRSCTFSNNTMNSESTQAFGGAMYVSNSPAVIEKSKFTNNILSDDYSSTAAACNIYGGAIYATTSNLIITRCSFNGNQCFIQRGVDPFAAGGAIYFNNCSSPTVTYCGFTSNICKNQEGGHYMAGGAMVNFNSNTQIVNCSFNSNYIQDIYSTGGSSLSHVGAFGGAIFNNSSTVSIDSSYFSGNANSHAYGGDQSYGGAVYDSLSAVTFTNDSFLTNTNGTTYGQGGAIYSDASTDSIAQCLFDHNTSPYGGAISTGADGGTMWVNNCSITNNTGGNTSGIFNDQNSILHLNDTYIYGGSGTGVYNYGSGMYIYGCHFDFNQSGISGGALYCQTTPNLIDSCLFENNYANDGGAIFMDNNTSLQVKRSIFANNTAYDGGGAIAFMGTFGSGSGTSVLKSDGNIFTGNNGYYFGGAISVYNIYSYLFSGNDTLVNNIFANNQSTNSTTASGGALSVAGSSHFVCNNTFAHNTASTGGSIASAGTSCYLTMYNNIFFQSAATGPFAGSSRDTALRGTGLYYFYNNISTGTNPQFVDSTNFAGADGIWKTADDGLALTNCSPAVNTGNNDYVLPTELVDVRGTTRIIGGTVDKGAYEAVTIGNVSGIDSICVGAMTTLSDTTGGGTWSSSDPSVATVGSSGVVTGVAAGNATISYSHTGLCTTDVSTIAIAVVRPASVITGPSVLCVSATIALTDSVSGGTWSSSSTSVATIGSGTGAVTGVAAGSVILTYHFSNACGVYNMEKTVTVNGLPALAVIAGPDTLCPGAQITLSSSLSGGTWSAVTGNTSVAGSGGSAVVTGISSGVDSVKYTLTNSCGSTVAKYVVTVFSVSHCDTTLSAMLAKGETLGVLVYPNPSHDEITVEFNSQTNEPSTLVITNILGEKVREWFVRDNKTTIPVNDLPYGTYILVATKGGKQYYYRIFVD